MPLSENSHPKEIHSFAAKRSNTPSAGGFPWAARNSRETDGRIPGNFCTNVPLFMAKIARHLRGISDCDGESKRGAREITLMLLSNAPFTSI